MTTTSFSASSASSLCWQYPPSSSMFAISSLPEQSPPMLSHSPPSSVATGISGLLESVISRHESTCSAPGYPSFASVMMAAVRRVSYACHAPTLDPTTARHNPISARPRHVRASIHTDRCSGCSTPHDSARARSTETPMTIAPCAKLTWSEPDNVIEVINTGQCTRYSA